MEPISIGSICNGKTNFIILILSGWKIQSSARSTIRTLASWTSGKENLPKNQRKFAQKLTKIWPKINKYLNQNSRICVNFIWLFSDEKVKTEISQRLERGEAEVGPRRPPEAQQVHGRLPERTSEANKAAASSPAKDKTPWRQWSPEQHRRLLSNEKPKLWKVSSCCYHFPKNNILFMLQFLWKAWACIKPTSK